MWQLLQCKVQCLSLKGQSSRHLIIRAVMHVRYEKALTMWWYGGHEASSTFQEQECGCWSHQQWASLTFHNLLACVLAGNLCIAQRYYCIRPRLCLWCLQVSSTGIPPVFWFSPLNLGNNMVNVFCQINCFSMCLKERINLKTKSTKAFNGDTTKRKAKKESTQWMP